MVPSPIYYLTRKAQRANFEEAMRTAGIAVRQINKRTYEIVGFAGMTQQQRDAVAQQVGGAWHAIMCNEHEQK